MAMVLEYFCLACHAYNKQRILDIKIAEEMAQEPYPVVGRHSG